MTTPTDVLRLILTRLSDLGIDYMVVGSFASSIYGIPRDTHDLDLVVVVDTECIPLLVSGLSDEFYIDEESVRKAIEQADMFNIIHNDGLIRVDFWVSKDNDFARTQFARRRATNAWGLPSYVESPEDTILSKLLWNQTSPSERQISDVCGILTVRRDRLDYDYLRSWAAKLGLADIVERLIEDSKCQEDHS